MALAVELFWKAENVMFKSSRKAAGQTLFETACSHQLQVLQHDLKADGESHGPQHGFSQLVMPLPITSSR